MVHLDISLLLVVSQKVMPDVYVLSAAVFNKIIRHADLSAFRTGGVPGPTSNLSPRAPAQMGRRETEREGGKKPEGDRRTKGKPVAFVFVPRPGRVSLQ
jgi:hypothetical protein